MIVGNILHIVNVSWLLETLLIGALASKGSFQIELPCVLSLRRSRVNSDDGVCVQLSVTVAWILGVYW